MVRGANEPKRFLCIFYRHIVVTRNRVRHKLLPLLENEFNPAITDGLSELAEIARAEEDYWDSEAEGWMGTVVQWFSPESSSPKTPSDVVQLTPLSSTPEDVETQESAAQPMNASVDRIWLLAEPLALQRRVIKSMGNQAGLSLEYKHIEEILRFAVEEEGGSGRELALPEGWKLVREHDALIFQAPDLQTHTATADYEYQLPVPGEVDIAEIGVRLEATPVVPGATAEASDPDHLFDRALLSRKLTVRNWRPGDRFWPAHTKCPKKVKELLQEHRVPHPQRKLWPVIVSGDEIIWIPGFPGAAKYRAQPGFKAVMLRELPSGGPIRAKTPAFPMT